MTLKEVFIKNLKKYRKKEGLSQMKLAELCNTGTSYIGDIEIGRRFPSLELIEKFALVLRIEPYFFFKDETGNTADTENMFPRMPNSMKKQINTQIKAKISQSTMEILDEISEILNEY